jgi:Response regulator containing CheY-like receiver domain and AraC-type DNA-binding domain
MWKIVLVDDDFQLVCELRKFIEQAGLNLECVGDAGNGRAALDVIHKTKPDIVMTDISMPIMDGLEMIEQLKTEEYPGVIILLSRFANFQYAQQALRFRVSDYLLKPAALPDLRNVLEKAVKELDGRRQVLVSGLNWNYNSRHKDTVDFMVRYINQNYGSDISLNDISKQLYLSCNYLNQIFQRDIGETFKNYLIRMRMEKAKDLLMEGKHYIYEVAEMVGYKNVSYFSNIFRKYTGYKPSEVAVAPECSVNRKNGIHRDGVA